MRYTLTLIFFFLLIGVSKAEEISTALPIPAPTTPAVIDFGSYSKISDGEEKVKLRKLAAELKKDDYGLKNSTVCIISYAGIYSYAGEARKRAFRAKHFLINNEKIDEPRITVIDGGYRENWTIELYIMPPGASQPSPEPTVARAYVKIYREKRVKKKKRTKL